MGLLDRGLRGNLPSPFTPSSGGGGSANSFETINAPAGTDPVADSSTDTLNLTSSDSSVTITGDSTTDTIDFVANAANKTLSNLTNPTSINQHLEFSADLTKDIGTLTNRARSVYTRNVESGDTFLNVGSAENLAGDTQPVFVNSGPASNDSGEVQVGSGTAGNISGPVTLYSGDADVQSGPIDIQPGAAPTRGPVRWRDGSEGTIGHVLTQTAVDGTGQWQPVTTGSGLTLPTNYYTVQPDVGDFSAIQDAIDQAVTDGHDTSNPAHVLVFPKTDGSAYSETLTFSPGVHVIGMSLEAKKFLFDEFANSFVETPTADSRELPIVHAVADFTFGVGATQEESLIMIQNMSFYHTGAGNTPFVINTNKNYVHIKNCQFFNNTPGNATFFGVMSGTDRAILIVEDSQCWNSNSQLSVQQNDSTHMFINCEFKGGRNSGGENWVRIINDTLTSKVIFKYCTLKVAAQSGSLFVVDATGDVSLDHCTLNTQGYTQNENFQISGSVRLTACTIDTADRVAEGGGDFSYGQCTFVDNADVQNTLTVTQYAEVHNSVA